MDAATSSTTMDAATSNTLARVTLPNGQAQMPMMPLPIPQTIMQPQEDVISQLHIKLAELSTVFFDSLGCLQRDAPPLDVHRPDPHAMDHIRRTAEAHAQKVVEVAKRMDALIDTIPEADEAEQCATLAELDARSEKLGAELQAQQAGAQATLQGIREGVQQIADDRITL
uniref:Mediator of RNA polymerase II transcription subunit 21 n=1 Tax=Eutreptiella gymnastica TaxID=73025 RepID=A0A7S1N589_9EUGL